MNKRLAGLMSFMTIHLKPIKQKRISDQVFDQLRELIFRGTIKPGEKLMTERELARAMGVSRTTVRDAVHRLSAMGLIVQRQGQGTFVKAQDRAAMEGPLAKAMKDQNATLEDLLEVRLGLECTAASLAAQRADSADLKAMDQSIEEMTAEINSGRMGTEADTSFHMAIAYAGKNPLHILIMRNFYDYLFLGIKQNLASLYEAPENIDLILKQHKAIFDAIKDRGPEAAYAAMHEHISYVMDHFRRQAEKQ